MDCFDPHEPWLAPEYMVQRYDPGCLGAPMLHPNYSKVSDYTQNMSARYGTEVELVDRWVGRVLQKLDDLALWDSSIVVFTSDHGLSLGEHDGTGTSHINKRAERCWPI